MSFTYKGLKANITKYTVTEEEVDRQIQRLLQQAPRITAVKDRPTEAGDEIVLDYAGFCDGVQFPGGTAERQTLVLGSGMFIPGFEEQLLDKVPGEKVVVNVTFPEKYHSEDLAGKAAQFHCTIHEIRIKTPYELDDTFAQEVGGCYTLEEMREQLGKSLHVEVSHEELESAVDAQMQNMEAQLKQQGLDLDMYCQFMSTTKDDLRKDARSAAMASLRNQAAIDKIVEMEKLEAAEDEIGQALAVIARQNNMTVEQLKGYYDAEFEQAVVKSVLTSKVMRLIRDAADVTVVE